MSCTIGVYATHSLESLKPAPAAARRLAHRRSRFCRIGSAVGGPLQAFANWCARPSPPRPPRPAGHAWWTSVTGRGVGGWQLGLQRLRAREVPARTASVRGRLRLTTRERGADDVRSFVRSLPTRP